MGRLMSRKRAHAWTNAAKYRGSTLNLNVETDLKDHEGVDEPITLVSLFSLILQADFELTS